MFHLAPRRLMLRCRLAGGTFAAATLAAASAPVTAAEGAPSVASPFLAEATAGFDARTFYLGTDLPGDLAREAWAIGGRLHGRTGFWLDRLQFGASVYVSLPLYAPADKDGTGLLAPGQQSIGVLGELFARVRLAGQTQATLGRQEIDLGPPRPAGARSNRSDSTYVGRNDGRMVPLTYEAVLAGGPVDDSVRVHAGWIDTVKLRNQESFIPVGQAFRLQSAPSPMWMAGLQFSPARDVWLQGWAHVVPDVIRIAFVDADAIAMRWAARRYLRLGAQFTDQRSDGAGTPTGQPASTTNLQVYAEGAVDVLTFYGVGSRTGSGDSLRTPLSSGPIYTSQLLSSFVSAGQQAGQLGVALDLGPWVQGLSAFADVTRGTGAVAGDAREIDVGVVWRLRRDDSFLDGLRSRVRAGWLTETTPLGRVQLRELRIDVNLPVRFL